jgi:hypothetical protein
MVEEYETIAEVRAAFTRGEIPVDGLRDALDSTDEDSQKDELWVRWAEQGLFDDPIEQEGFLAFPNGVPTEVDGDG